jgi:multisubunit Na+/H+ antiporter MnhB subunit
MDLITLIVVLVVVGVLLYLINRYVPMEPRIKKILNVAVIIFVLLWLIFSFLNTAGVNVHSPRID